MNQSIMKPRVLHIDDSSDFLEVFVLIFKEWFDITSMADCCLAINEKVINNFDVIILDFEMPKMDGLTCLKKIKEINREIPVIFFTGQGNEEIAREAFIMGASDYFTKAIGGFALTEKIVNSVHRAIEIKNERKVRLETEEKYRTLVDLSPDPIVIVQDSKFKFVNSAFIRLFGYTTEDIEQGFSFYKLVLEKDRDTSGQILEARLSGKNILQKYIIDLISKSGEIINCEISNTTIDYLGKPALIKIIHNVTEHKRDKERVERYREQLSVLGEESHIKIGKIKESISGMESIETKKQFLVNGKYSIKDLVDIAYLKRIMESFSSATGFTTGFVSLPEQEVLFGTGWRDICTKFHRVLPESLIYCKKSNEILSEGLNALKEVNINLCENGLIDGATPIIIKKAHVANLFTGQMLFEKPDIERFKRQAKKYGYDEEAYLEALRKVPVVPEAQFKSVMTFLSEMATLIAELGLSNLLARENAQVLAEEIAESKHMQKELMESEKKYHQFLDVITDGLSVVDNEGTIIYTNPKLLEMLGYNFDEMNGFSVFNFFDEDNGNIVKEQFSKRKEGSREVYEIEWTGKNDNKVRTMNSPQPIFNEKGEFKGSLILVKHISHYNQTAKSLHSFLQKNITGLI